MTDAGKKRGKCMRIILAVLVLLLASGGVFTVFSPWPAVWLLRNGKDGPIDAPEGYEQQIAGIKVEKDRTYPSRHKKNQYDLYLPKGNEPAPLILWVHGGAFVAGDKYGLEIWGSLLASQGYAVAAMNYEWAPEAVWPAQVIQIGECLEELNELSQQGAAIDMTSVFLAGDSAGAHMAAQAATACFNPEYAEKTGLSMPLKKGALKGVLLYCGPYEISAFSNIENKAMNFFMNKVGQSYVGTLNWQKHENVRLLNVIPWMTEECPPVYLTDGNTGSFESQGKHLGEALRGLGVEVTERYFDKSEGEIPHEYQMQLTSSQGQSCYEDTLEFLQLHSEREGVNHE